MRQQVRAHLTVETAVGVRLTLASLSRGAGLQAPSSWLKAMRERVRGHLYFTIIISKEAIP